MSAVMHACLEQDNVALARRVYDLCSRQGVYPVPSQFNRLMDVYASESRCGASLQLTHSLPPSPARGGGARLWGCG